MFTDVTRGDKHRIDILVETRLKGESGIVLVHVENQASAEKDFAERMFIYFSRLYQKHRCRVVPIAIFTYPEKRNEPDRFERCSRLCPGWIFITLLVIRYPMIK